MTIVIYIMDVYVDTGLKLLFGIGKFIYECELRKYNINISWMKSKRKQKYKSAKNNSIKLCR